MAKKPNIDDIAKAAFVSRSVVSRVINNRPNVSSHARDRVQAAIKRYGYTPSSAARSLATDKTYEISILAPRRKDHVFANAFWSLVFLGLSEACIRRGYFASLNTISKELDPVLKNRILRAHGMDGYVFIGHEVAAEALEVVEELGKPAVVLGHDTHNEHLASVDVDNVGGARKAIRYLIGIGHRRIGLITGQFQAQEVLDRIDGFYKAHQDYAIAVDKSLLLSGEFSHRSGYKSMQRLLLHRPTAVFCTSDAQAMGALLAIHEAGFKVPQDISVIGYDDLPAAQFTIPPLTTIRQPIYSMGKQASETLINLIEGTQEGSPRVMLQPTIVKRKSCAPLAD